MPAANVDELRIALRRPHGCEMPDRPDDEAGDPKAQAEPAALAALSAYMADRRCQSGKIIEKAQARGEVRAGARPELITELLSSFAWGRLLTERLDVSDEEIDAVVDTVLSGIASKPAA